LDHLGHPQRWGMQLVRDFMLFVGPVSSLFDFLTFYVLLRVLHATQPLFHTGWFVESLAMQTLVLFVIKTMQNRLYQACNAGASFALKKTPPMPVTRFM
jgi:Mg2+-importing ATPase